MLCSWRKAKRPTQSWSRMCVVASISFALLRSAIMCIRGSRATNHRPVSSLRDVDRWPHIWSWSGCLWRAGLLRVCAALSCFRSNLEFGFSFRIVLILVHAEFGFDLWLEHLLPTCTYAYTCLCSSLYSSGFCFLPIKEACAVFFLNYLHSPTVWERVRLNNKRM